MAITKEKIVHLEPQRDGSFNVRVHFNIYEDGVLMSKTPFHRHVLSIEDETPDLSFLEGDEQAPELRGMIREGRSQRRIDAARARREAREAEPV